MEEEKYINALIKLHRGLQRQGPGDTDFSNDIIKQLPELPQKPRIADIGCGAGAGTLILAKKYQVKIKAVDFSKTFLDQMMHQAKQEGLADLIEPIERDMGDLDWPERTIDLLWSEGAAYNITFAGALKAWRPLMANNGIAMISEMNYFSSNVHEDVTHYMEHAYPDIKSEAENISLINSSGYKVLMHRRLPSNAWFDNYYEPLQANIRALKDTGDKIMQAVINETEEEIQFFKTHHQDYGYTYYIMRAV